MAYLLYGRYANRYLFFEAAGYKKDILGSFAYEFELLQK